MEWPIESALHLNAHRRQCDLRLGRRLRRLDAGLQQQMPDVRLGTKAKPNRKSATAVTLKKEPQTVPGKTHARPAKITLFTTAAVSAQARRRRDASGAHSSERKASETQRPQPEKQWLTVKPSTESPKFRSVDPDIEAAWKEWCDKTRKFDDLVTRRHATAESQPEENHGPVM